MVGSYVRFTDGNSYIVTKELGDDTVQVYNPLENLKKAVAKRNLEPLAVAPAVLVEYRDNRYLVTRKRTIISMTSCKAMKWGDTSGDRRAILVLANL